MATSNYSDVQDVSYCSTASKIMMEISLWFGTEMVGIPACLEVSSDDDALKLRTHLREKFGVEVHIYYQMPKHEEVATTTGYGRVSHQVYNKVDDYYKFKDAINQLVCDGFTCA